MKFKKAIILTILMFIGLSVSKVYNKNDNAGKPVTISNKSITLQVGKSKKLSLKNVKASKVKWTSKNKKIATVSKYGKVVAKKVGSTQVYAQIKGKKKKYTCKVKVVKKSSKKKNSSSNGDKKDSTKDDKKDEAKDEKKDEKTTETSKGVMSVTISVSTTEVQESGTLQVTTTIKNNKIAKDKKERWYISNPIGTIDSNGLFTPKAIGTAYVRLFVTGKTSGGVAVNEGSNIIQITVKSDYTYEIYPLSNFYNGSMYADAHIGVSGGAIFIKTDAPSLNIDNLDFQLYDKNGKLVECGYINRFNFMEYSYSNLQYEDWNIAKTNGGFTGRVDTCCTGWSGDCTLVLTVIAGSSYTPLAQTKIHVYDTNEEWNKWEQNFLNTYTTPQMSVHEKMLALCQYFNTYCYHNGTRSRTNELAPRFISGCTDSYSLPMMLCKFAGDIGYEGVSCDYIEQQKTNGRTIQHGYASGFYNGVEYFYTSEEGVGLKNSNMVTFGIGKQNLNDLITQYSNQWIEN